jgi:hypothetical protein
MGVRPVIYVSAVSTELRSAREVAGRALRGLGYETIWEEIPEGDAGDQRHALERRIDASRGVLQLVGRCYGGEPPLSSRPGGRVSYTQYEAHYARQCGKPVWYLILDDTFVTDRNEPEREDLQTLQAAYLRRVEGYQKFHQPIGDDKALTARIYELSDEFDPLRRGARIWAASVALLAALSIGLGVWFLRDGRAHLPFRNQNPPPLRSENLSPLPP